MSSVFDEEEEELVQNQENFIVPIAEEQLPLATGQSMELFVDMEHSNSISQEENVFESYKNLYDMRGSRVPLVDYFFKSSKSIEQNLFEYVTSVKNAVRGLSNEMHWHTPYIKTKDLYVFQRCFPEKIKNGTLYIITDPKHKSKTYFICFTLVCVAGSICEYGIIRTYDFEEKKLLRYDEYSAGTIHDLTSTRKILHLAEVLLPTYII